MRLVWIMLFLLCCGHRKSEVNDGMETKGPDIFEKTDRFWTQHYAKGSGQKDADFLHKISKLKDMGVTEVPSFLLLLAHPTAAGRTPPRPQKHPNYMRPTQSTIAKKKAPVRRPRQGQSTQGSPELMTCLSPSQGSPHARLPLSPHHFVRRNLFGEEEERDDAHEEMEEEEEMRAEDDFPVLVISPERGDARLREGDHPQLHANIFDEQADAGGLAGGLEENVMEDEEGIRDDMTQGDEIEDEEYEREREREEEERRGRLQVLLFVPLIDGQLQPEVSAPLQVVDEVVAEGVDAVGVNPVDEAHPILPLPVPADEERPHLNAEALARRREQQLRALDRRLPQREQAMGMEEGGGERVEENVVRERRENRLRAALRRGEENLMRGVVTRREERRGVDDGGAPLLRPQPAEVRVPMRMDERQRGEEREEGGERIRRHAVVREDE